MSIIEANPHLYDAEARLITYLILLDSGILCILLKGDLALIKDNQVSGGPMTVTFNSFDVSFWSRIGFYELNPSEDFNECVNLATYGDDGAYGSREGLTFGHTDMQKFYASRGVKYTMSDKAADSKPYSNISEIDFLKRKFLVEQHPVLGRVVLDPIEPASVYKMLSWTSARDGREEVRLLQLLENLQREAIRQPLEERLKMLSLSKELEDIYVKTFGPEPFAPLNRDKVIELVMTDSSTADINYLSNLTQDEDEVAYEHSLTIIW